jgi:uncharacterized protein YndB with AHSA1/START domain
MCIRSILSLLFALMATNALAHGPSRQKVTETIKINAPAAEVWNRIADFCAISHWHPGIAKCTVEGGNAAGAKRTLRIGKADGPIVVEELQVHDPAGMMYRYKIVKTDNTVLPVTTYSAFLTVKDNGDKTSTVEWRSGFYRAYTKNNPPPELNDQAALSAVSGAYQAGLANLKKLVEQQ